MDVVRFRNADEYAAAAMPLLLRHEAENCFFLGCLDGTTDLTDWLLCVVRDDDGAPLAAATMTPGHQMVITRTPDAAAAALAGHLHREAVGLPGVGGFRPTADAFARHWARLTGAATHVHVEMAVHQLTKVIPPRPAGGAIRVAAADDIELVGQWITDFRVEIGEGRLGSGRPVAEKRVPHGMIVLWEDHGRPVAMTGISGPTPHGMRVNLVYTPPQHRGRGYASNLVAGVSQRLLDSGRKFCFLYTDLSNPTSNKIYRQLGYEPVSESVHIMFDGPAGSH